MDAMGWEDKWLVGQHEDGAFMVLKVQARYIAQFKVWQCNLRPNCRTKMLESVPEERVYATEARALARVAELSKPQGAR
jgi:hypothetical protein